jgi:ribokinase
VVDVELIAALGDDADGHWVLNELAARGISGDWLTQDDSGRTCLCIILVEADGSRAIISEPSRLNHQCVLQRIQHIDALRNRKHLHVDGFHAAAVLASLDQARRLGWSTSLDVDELSAEWFSATKFIELLGAFDIVFINRNCAARLFPDSDISGWCERLSALAAMTGRLILLTLGAQGSVVIAARQAPVAITPLTVASVDTTGAGDVFAGIFLSAWLNGLTPVEAATHANIGAALSTTAGGAQGYLPDAAAITRAAPAYAAAHEKTHTDH